MISFFYASRGDTKIVGEEIIARSEQIIEVSQSSFSDSEASFDFIGASELISLHRQRPNFSLELPFVEILSRGENYILLSKLRDYFKFVSDDGKLRRYLFDSNVRDFMGLNPINEDIKDTLRHQASPDFWWLNNGITILSSGASVIGKSIKLADIQIVNGLQTTESIYRHFNQGESDQKDRAVLVKIVVSNEDDVRDAIIRSTNNQTHVELSSLHATDKIQRDIEDILYRHGLYYERRKNYYVNMGHSPSEIITPVYMATGVVALVLRNPQRAYKLKPRFMRSEDAYNSVFSDSIPIEIWPIIGHLLKKVDKIINEARSRYGLNKPNHNGEPFINRFRPVIAFCYVAKVFKSFNFDVNDLLTLDIQSVLDDDLIKIVRIIMIESVDDGFRIRGLRGGSQIKSGCARIAEVFEINDLEKWFQYGRKELTNSSRKMKKDKIKIKNFKSQITPAFLQRVNELLPEQPWKPGIDKLIIEKLQCKRGEYFAATSLLIEKGLRFEQKDGVLYDKNGNIVSYDKERVNPENMQLFDNT